jgi:cell division protein FtsZ
MNTEVQPEAAIAVSKKTVRVRLFGVGNAGINVMEQLAVGGGADLSLAAVNTDGSSLAGASALDKVHLETKPLRGLGSGGDPERGRALAEEHLPQLKALCEGVDVVFIVAGLGGGAGTGVGPVVARAAKESGALALGFVTLPFACEGARRQRMALHGLEELKEAADGVICLPNEKICKLIDENTSVLDTFKLSNRLLAEGVRGIWHLLSHPGLIEIHFDELSSLIREHHTESSFGFAEAMGATRSREVVDQLLAHPLLEGGAALVESEAVLVSLMGGPDLTMAEVNRVMEQLRQKCGRAQVIMGAAINEGFRERLAVTLIAARNSPERGLEPVRTPGRAEGLDSQLLTEGPAVRSASRFVAPPPAPTPERFEQIRKGQGVGSPRGRKSSSKLRQSQLPLEIISKGRFDKSEPTIHKGEDLDVPTYIRRNMSLN